MNQLKYMPGTTTLFLCSKGRMLESLLFCKFEAQIDCISCI